MVQLLEVVYSPDGADGTIEEIGALARESSFFLGKMIMAVYIDLEQ